MLINNDKFMRLVSALTRQHYKASFWEFQITARNFCGWNLGLKGEN